MGGSRLPRGSSAAFLLGAVAGIGTRCVEYASNLLYRVEPLLAIEGLAAYGLAGGALGVLGLWLLFPLGAPARSIAGIGVLGVPSLALVYFVNVRLLPNVPYSSAAGLVANGATLLVIALAAFWLTRGLGLHGEVGPRRTRAVPAIAVCVALGMILGARWPRANPYPDRQGGGPDLLLIVLDATRPDHLSLYGYGRATTPKLEARAARSRVYDLALAGSTWTAPSVDRLLRPVVDGATVPERLARQGYNTACLTDNPNVGPRSELARSFDFASRSVPAWRDVVRRTALHVFVERLWPGRDERLLQRAAAWISADAGPTFTYAHLMDVHAPYEHWPIDGVRRPGRRIVFPQDGTKMTDAEREDVVARYDGAIRHVDGLVDRLLASVERRGRPYLAIITADHGERLGEGGRWGHGAEIDALTLRVPLIVVGDGVRPGRVTEPVGAASVARTFLAAAGLECPNCPGSDLRESQGDAFIDGGVPPHERYRVRGRLLLVAREASPPRLFDLGTDPDMMRDLAPGQPALVADLADELATGRRLPQPSPDDVERLRALGYVQ